MVKIDQAIEEQARQILQDNGLYQVPTDPIRLAQGANIRVKAAIFNDHNVAGILSIKDGETVIYANAADPLERKRFTVAHELGHYFLGHKDEKVDMYRTIHGSNSSPEEQDANKFAAALLMDELLVKNMWQDFPSVSIMADMFKVSFEAMSIRLSNLGLG